MVCTRPNIAYAVSVVSRYLANPGKNHWEAVKWILTYLRDTANVSLVYGTNRGNHVDVTGFVDSDYAKDLVKAFGRHLEEIHVTWIQFGKKQTRLQLYTKIDEEVVYKSWRQLQNSLWKATLQHVVALSTIKAGYMALTEAMNEAIWLRGLLEKLSVKLNTLAVLEAKTVEVLKVGTGHNVADALTKVVHGLMLQHCLELLSVGIV
ncbi:hypothetical protein Tco_0996339 [Tanacetum coccineum]